MLARAALNKSSSPSTLRTESLQHGPHLGSAHSVAKSTGTQQQQLPTTATAGAEAGREHSRQGGLRFPDLDPRSRAAEQRLNSTQLNAQRYWLPTLAPRTSAKNRDAD